MGEEKVLVDSDVLVAIVKRDDVHHARVRKLLKVLVEDSCELWVTNQIVSETATVISNRIGMDAVRKFYSGLDDLVTEKLFIDLGIESITWVLFLKQAKKGTSFVDCSNVVVCREYKLDKIFSFDGFYKRMGLKMVG